MYYSYFKVAGNMLSSLMAVGVSLSRSVKYDLIAASCSPTMQQLHILYKPITAVPFLACL